MAKKKLSEKLSKLISELDTIQEGIESLEDDLEESKAK